MRPIDSTQQFPSNYSLLPEPSSSASPAALGNSADPIRTRKVTLKVGGKSFSVPPRKGTDNSTPLDPEFFQIFTKIIAVDERKIKRQDFDDGQCMLVVTIPDSNSESQTSVVTLEIGADNALNFLSIEKESSLEFAEFEGKSHSPVGSSNQAPVWLFDFADNWQSNKKHLRIGSSDAQSQWSHAALQKQARARQCDDGQINGKWLSDVPKIPDASERRPQRSEDGTSEASA